MSVSAYRASIVAPSDAGAAPAGALAAVTKLMRFDVAALGLDFVAFFFADDLANCGLLKLKVLLAILAYKNRLLESDRIGNDAPIQVRKKGTCRKGFRTLCLCFGANLDEGAIWPTCVALKELTAVDEARFGNEW